MPDIHPDIREGDRVQIHYTARFADGTLFASSLPGDALEFSAGGSEVIEGLSWAVVGMAVGETRRVVVPPEKAFGRHDPGLERRVPRASMPEDVKPGDQLSAAAGGREMAVWVRRVEGDDVVVDGNHPLAGQTLIFEFEVVACRPADGAGTRPG
jgi:peptidylprolyl isomerase